MKAIIVTPGKKGSSRLIEIEEPKLAPNEVLVKTLLVGIDSTDREIDAAEYGEAPENNDYLVLGHEALGKVMKIGEDLKRDGNMDIEEGNLVVPTVRRPDDCHYCRLGEPDMCIKGNYTERGIKKRHGFLQEYFTEEPKFLVKIPEILGSLGVLLEPLSVVEKGIRQGYKIQERMNWNPQTALVLGLGPIGIWASLIFKLRGLDVFVYSREEESNPRVKIIKTVGISYCSNKVDLNNLPNKIGKNLDFIFEATGNSIIAMKAMRLVGQNGVLCLTGVTGGHKKVTLCADCLNLDLVLGNKLIFGTVNANRIDFERGVEDMVILHKRYPGLLKKILSHKYDPESFKEGLINFEGIKAVIQFEKL